MLYSYCMYVVVYCMLYVVYICIICCTYSGMEERPCRMPELKLINQIKYYCLSIVAIVYCSLEKCMHVCDVASYYICS